MLVRIQGGRVQEVVEKGGRTAGVDVLEADVEGGVGVRCEDGPRLADNVPRSAVLVPIGVANLQKVHVSPTQSNSILPISIRPCQETRHRRS